jgi:S1-C subfamily serine protease
MNTAVAQSSAGNAPAQNIGFAIAIDSIKARLAGLRAGGTKSGSGSGATSAPVPFMGVYIESVTPTLATQKHLTPKSGAYVEGLAPSGPAQAAGIKTGDVIVSFAGTPVTSASQLVTVLRQHKPGDHVAVGLYRGSHQLTVHVTLGSEPG